MRVCGEGRACGEGPVVMVCGRPSSYLSSFLEFCDRWPCAVLVLLQKGRRREGEERWVEEGCMVAKRGFVGAMN